MTFGRPASESSPVPPHAAAKAQVRSPTKRVAARRGRLSVDGEAMGRVYPPVARVRGPIPGCASL